MKYAFLFPGQGAQSIGMGKGLYDANPDVRHLFEEASDIGGKDFSEILFRGSPEKLNSTDVTQIAVTLVNLASGIVLESRGITPSICAGFSLGEYSALHAAGVLSRSDALRVVNARGILMERVSREMDTAGGPVGMMAVLGLNIEETREAIQGIQEVFIAVHSGPNQVVLAGTHEGLKSVEPPLDEAGALNLVRLKVSGPFHSPLLSGAREEFQDLLSRIPFSNPRIPIIVNTKALSPRDGDELRRTSIDQLDHPVLWMDSQKRIIESQPDCVLETGPGSVLSGIWKTLHSGQKCRPAGTMEEIEGLI